MPEGASLAPHTEWLGRPATEVSRGSIGIFHADGDVMPIDLSSLTATNLLTNSDPSAACLTSLGPASGQVEAGRGGETAPLPAMCAFHAWQLAVAWVLCPYAQLLMFGTMVTCASALYAVLGLVGLILLFWVAATAATLTQCALVVVTKWLLLGRVRPGEWPIGGSFHARKHAVDQLAFQLGPTLHISTLLATPCHTSAFVHVLVRCFGIDTGGLVNFVTSANLAGPSLTRLYDLFSVKDGCFFGGNSEAYAFSEIGGRVMRAGEIRVGRDVSVGARAILLGGTTFEDGASIAAFSIARSGKLHSNEMIVGTTIVRKQARCSRLDPDTDRKSHSSPHTEPPCVVAPVRLSRVTRRRRQAIT